MLPWDDALTYMKRAAQDPSASALDFLKSMYNVGYQKILTEFGRQVTEKTVTTTLGSGQRTCVVPPDALFPKTLELVDGTTRQPITEVASDRTWAYMKSGNIQGRPTNYHYKPRFGVGGGVLELYPIPSGNTYILEFTYEGNDKNLSQLEYTVGTMTINAGSAAVLGIGTTFTQSMLLRYLIPTDGTADNMPYRITGFTDTTHLTLETVYNGSNLSGSAFKIVEIPALPQDMHIMPCHYSLAEWWSSRGNQTKMTEFDGKFTRGMQIAKKTHAGVTRDEIVNPPIPILPFAQYPLNYPTSITE